MKYRGTTEIKTERLLLRRYSSEDAKAMHEKFGRDPKMFEYSGWNPYETEEMAEKTISGFIDSYDDPRFYGWAIDLDEPGDEGVTLSGRRLIGTAGAFDYDDASSRIEVGMSIERECWGKGYASEALKAILEYLTESEGISSVTAWCADENTGSLKVMQKAGMVMTERQKDSLQISGATYDKLIFEYSLNK
jgi:ribosomal-protein-alanine N-acetyltransferase